MNAEHWTWAKAAVSIVDPTLELKAVSRPADGLANQVLFLETTGPRQVLKVYGEDGGVAARRETALANYARELGLPFPDVLVAGELPGETPLAFAVYERLPGAPWSQTIATMPEPEVCGLYGALGALIARIHATERDACGYIAVQNGRLVPEAMADLASGELSAGPFASWQEMHRAIVAERLRGMAHTPFADLAPAVERFMTQRDHLLAQDVTPRLLHMDLHGSNILVHEGEISGIVDGEEAMIGHNEYELMRIDLAHFRDAPPDRKSAFMAAYSSAIPLDPGFEARQPVYEASRTLAWIASLIRNHSRYAPDQWTASARAARDAILSLARN